MTAAAMDASSGHAVRGVGELSATLGWWALLIFLLNEGALFASLIASYFYLGVSNPSWPPAGTAAPELRLPLIMTGILLSSSVVCALAERAHRRGTVRGYRALTLCTALLGVAFLLVQAREYQNKLMVAGPTENAYESMFFTITGLHGLHVAFGVLFLCWALLREWRGTSPPPSLAIRNASTYWHFVDGVWLAILMSLYLSPRWH